MFSTFSGMGAPENALEELGVQHEIVGYSEIDKYAGRAYSVLHNVPESLNYGDITAIDEMLLPDFDLLTYGFPCQDISVAGRQAGIVEGETRSGLVHELLRILKYNKPKYAICENVKNLVGKKFRKEFDYILAELESYGYKNYWQVLNAKDHGVPQNRERVFIVSIREDIDQSFEFPAPYDNGVRLRDVLEDVVDEKYFISDEKCAKLLEQLKEKQITPGTYSGIKGFRPSEVACTIDANCYKGIECNQQRNAVAIPCTTPDRMEKNQNGRRFKDDGDPMFTLTTQDRHGVLICCGVAKIKNDGFSSRLDSNYYKGLDNHGMRTGVLVGNGIDVIGTLDISGHDMLKRVYSTEGIAPTLPTGTSGNSIPKILMYWRIRKLIPLECFRLMAFRDSDFYKLKNAGISDSQLYKMAGNSIVVTVLKGIMSNLFADYIPQSEYDGLLD